MVGLFETLFSKFGGFKKMALFMLKNYKIDEPKSL